MTQLLQIITNQPSKKKIRYFVIEMTHAILVYMHTKSISNEEHKKEFSIRGITKETN